jgi:hypothetical protein
MIILSIKVGFLSDFGKTGLDLTWLDLTCYLRLSENCWSLNFNEAMWLWFVYIENVWFYFLFSHLNYYKDTTEVIFFAASRSSVNIVKIVAILSRFNCLF